MKLKPFEEVEFGSVQPGEATPPFDLRYDEAKHRIYWSHKGSTGAAPVYVFVRDPKPEDHGKDR
jgi:hypothetical protein